MGITTNLVAANQNESYRITVPSSIAKQFNLIAGDKLDWELSVVGKELKIILTPIKTK